MISAFFKALRANNPGRISRPDHKLLQGIISYEATLDALCMNPSSKETRQLANSHFKQLKRMVDSHELPLLETPDGLRVLRELTHDNKRHLLTPERAAGLLEELKALGAKPVSFHPFEQAKRDLKALYHRRYLTIERAEEAVQSFTRIANGGTAKLFKPEELESLSLPDLNMRLRKLRDIPSGKKGYNEAAALIPHMESLAEARKGEDRFREAVKHLLPEGSTANQEMDKLWNSVAAERGFNAAERAEKLVAHAAKPATQEAARTWVSSSVKQAEKSGGKTKWIIGGGVAAVAIGAFLCRDKNKNHANREDIRRTTLSTGQELS